MHQHCHSSKPRILHEPVRGRHARPLGGQHSHAPGHSSGEGYPHLEDSTVDTDTSESCAGACIASAPSVCCWGDVSRPFPAHQGGTSRAAVSSSSAPSTQVSLAPWCGTSGMSRPAQRAAMRPSSSSRAASPLASPLTPASASRAARAWPRRPALMTRMRMHQPKAPAVKSCWTGTGGGGRMEQRRSPPWRAGRRRAASRA